MGTVHQGSFNGSPTIDAELLAQLLRSGRNVVVVDLRSKEEFSEGHIEGARWIPIHQLVARACEIATEHSAPIVVVSSAGNRSKIAAASLRLAGFTEVASLAGGMNGWRELGLPICSSVTHLHS